MTARIEYVHVEHLPEVWSADDIREDFPEGADQVTDDQIGVLFHSGAGDGALLYGPEDAVIAKLEAVIALIRRERAIHAGDVAEHAEVRLTLGEPLPDEMFEVLRDEFEADQAAGDADWHGGAAYVYVIERDIDGDRVYIPAGVYLRQVWDNSGAVRLVTSGNVDAYIDAMEARYVAETGDN